MNLEASFSPGIIAFSIVAGLLLLGILLRAQIPFFQRFLWPASIIGGAVGLGLMALGYIPIANDTFAIIAYHIFNIGVITIALTGNDRQNSRPAFRGALWLALMWVSIFCIQSLIGLGIFWGWNQFTQEEIFPGLGFLTGMGFAQGPGQSLAIASVWELENSISYAISIGLAFSAIGFFAAFLTGVPLANRGWRRGWFEQPKTELSRDFLRGIMEGEEKVPTGYQTTHPANIDSLAWHAALVLSIYGLCFLAAQGLQAIAGETMKSLVYGFIFMIGLLLATLVRWAFQQLRIGFLIDRPTLKRFTGSLVDIGIIPVMLAIQIEVILAFIVPIGLSSVLSLLFTWTFANYLGKRLPLPYKRERALVVYGGTTGTVANSLLLLKIIDPYFQSMLAFELVFYNFFAIFTSSHLILLFGILPTEDGFGLFHMVLVLVGTMSLATVGIFFLHKRWGKEALDAPP